MYTGTCNHLILGSTCIVCKNGHIFYNNLTIILNVNFHIALYTNYNCCIVNFIDGRFHEYEWRSEQDLLSSCGEAQSQYEATATCLRTDGHPLVPIGQQVQQH